jgi:hypothetical protein
MLSGLYVICLFAGSLLAPGPQATPAPGHQAATSMNAFGDCTDKRERCIESCGKQRQACDRNTPNDARCVGQQNQCEAGCNNAWKKCEENSGGKLSSGLSF